MDSLRSYFETLLARRRSVDNETGCWEWIGGRTPDGYGTITVSAHRLAALLWLDLGTSDRRHVCHRCDNPACHNPEHLYLGSMKENARDRARRGRGRENGQKGRTNPNVKLTEAQVREILRLVKVEGFSQERVAEMFGVRQPHVSRIVRGVAWGVLPDAPAGGEDRPVRKRQPVRPYNRGEAHPSATVTEVQAREILALHASGVRQSAMAKAFGLSAAQVNNIVKRRAWRHVADPSLDEVTAARQRWDEQRNVS